MRYRSLGLHGRRPTLGRGHGDGGASPPLTAPRGSCGAAPAPACGHSSSGNTGAASVTPTGTPAIGVTRLYRGALPPLLQRLMPRWNTAISMSTTTTSCSSSSSWEGMSTPILSNSAPGRRSSLLPLLVPLSTAQALQVAAVGLALLAARVAQVRSYRHTRIPAD